MDLNNYIQAIAKKKKVKTCLNIKIILKFQNYTMATIFVTNMLIKLALKYEKNKLTLFATQFLNTKVYSPSFLP